MTANYYVDIEALSELEDLSSLGQLGELASLGELGKLGDITGISEMYNLYRLEELSALSQLEQLGELGQLSRLNNLGNNIDIKRLADLGTLGYLGDLGDMGDELWDLSKHRTDVNVGDLSNLNELADLVSLKNLENLEVLGVLGTLSAYEFPTLNDASTLRLKQSLGYLINLSNLGKLGNLWKLSKLSRLSTLGESVTYGNLHDLLSGFRSLMISILGYIDELEREIDGGVNSTTVIGLLSNMTNSINGNEPNIFGVEELGIYSVNENTGVHSYTGMVYNLLQSIDIYIKILSSHIPKISNITSFPADIPRGLDNINAGNIEKLKNIKNADLTAPLGTMYRSVQSEVSDLSEKITTFQSVILEGVSEIELIISTSPTPERIQSKIDIMKLTINDSFLRKFEATVSNLSDTIAGELSTFVNYLK